MSKPSYKCTASGCSYKYFHSLTDNNYKNKKCFWFPEKDNSRRQNWIQIMKSVLQNQVEVDYQNMPCHSIAEK